MCGIAGFYSFQAGELQLRGMCRQIAHRGPDADGFFMQDGVGLGHRRLSIIDLSATANQPMFSDDGDWVIGCFYNRGSCCCVCLH